ncbi:MAG: hypothetical protein Q9183_004861, partial [Haloplaca sp. 2 TL-2023]
MIISETVDAFPDGHDHNSWTDYSARQKLPFRTSLLLVNHQLAEEAAAFIFKNTTFQINISEVVERASDGSRSAAVEFARRAVYIFYPMPVYRVMASVQHWQLSVRWNHRGEADGSQTRIMSEMVRQSCEWLKHTDTFCTLKVQIPCLCLFFGPADRDPNASDRTNLESHGARVLEILEPLRRLPTGGIGRVSLVATQAWDSTAFCDMGVCQGLFPVLNGLKTSLERDTPIPDPTPEEHIWKSIKAHAAPLFILQPE